MLSHGLIVNAAMVFHRLMMGFNARIVGSDCILVWVAERGILAASASAEHCRDSEDGKYSHIQSCLAILFIWKRRN
jgi:hypothetical protein